MSSNDLVEEIIERGMENWETPSIIILYTFSQVVYKTLRYSEIKSKLKDIFIHFEGFSTSKMIVEVLTPIDCTSCVRMYKIFA